MIAWSDIGVRARGLSTHLLSPEQVRQLAGLSDLEAVAERLRGLGVPVGPAADPAALELAVRRRAAAELARLARWAGPRAAVLTVIFEDEERRALRALVRGALQAVPPERRLAGLVPTPNLPERALQALAALTTPGEVAALLAAWRHPYAAPLQAELREREPDPLELETGLNRTFAERATRAARRGGRELRTYVTEVLREEEALTAKVLTDDAVGDADLDPGEENRRLAARIVAWRARARVAPLGPAPVLLFALRVRAQVINLQTIVWGRVLGADAAAMEPALVGLP